MSNFFNNTTHESIHFHFSCSRKVAFEFVSWISRNHVRKHAICLDIIDIDFFCRIQTTNNNASNRFSIDEHNHNIKRANRLFEINFCSSENRFIYEMSNRHVEREKKKQFDNERMQKFENWWLNDNLRSSIHFDFNDDDDIHNEHERANTNRKNAKKNKNRNHDNCWICFVSIKISRQKRWS